MGNLADSATSLVATAPSPATSGTSLVVTAGEGVVFPATPFFAVLHPDGSLPVAYGASPNAEYVQVTNRSTDTLTIVRAQKSTTAKTVATNWRISNVYFKSDYDDKQNADPTLTALAAYNTNGSVHQTAADTFVGHTLTGTANQLTVTNGDGVSGNPTISLPADVVVPTVLTAPNTGLHVLDTNASHDLIVKPGSDLTADRTLTITTGDANRLISVLGDLSIVNSLSVPNNFGLTLTQTGTTNVTLPTTGTLATLAGTESLTNKTHEVLHVSGSGSPPAAPATGFGKIHMAGTGAVRPKFTSSTGTVETLQTDQDSRILGYAQITSSFTASSTAAQDVTGLTTTVTTPTLYGNQRVEVMFFASQKYSSVDSNRIDLALQQDGVDIFTAYDRTWIAANGGNGNPQLLWCGAPAAGSHTYKVRIATGVGAGVGTIFAVAAAPAFIRVRVL